jgi:segregation and condensation protein A
MAEEDKIIQMVIEKQSWEEVLYYIVSIENMDPWNIDLVKLTEGFISYIGKIEKLDFRIPAKIVFVAAVLLKLKADYLSIFEEQETFDEAVKKQDQFTDLGIDPNLVQLGIPMKRMPKRQVTLDELIVALKKAMVVRERKVERRQLWRARLQADIKEDDITERIENMMKEIDELMLKMHETKLKFSQIVKKWERNQIVRNFIPLLHLERDQKVTTEQLEFFKEIFISKKTDAENK